MAEPPRPPPSLTSLCIDDLARELLSGDGYVFHIIQDIYELPSHLLDELISRLPPFALYNFNLHMPFKDPNKEDFPHDDSTNNKRKRSRDWNLNTAWQKLFKLRWPNKIDQIQPTDWQQVYWETHLQNCLDEAAEIALITSFKGRIGDIEISDSILCYIGFVGLAKQKYSKYSKLSYHCLQFSSHVSCLTLQNVLCTAETTRLLRECKLQSLVLRCIRSKEQVDGLCKLITQHSRTLTSLEFIHCTVYEDFINAILDSVGIKGVPKHGIRHLSIVSSSFGKCTVSLPSGLESFLSSARSLCSLKLFDNRLGRNFAKSLFVNLLEASSGISVLDLSENEISGCLSCFNRRLSCGSHLSRGIGKSLQLLRVLNLRGNNLRKDDAENLGYALAYMPNLEDLDISDNSIGDDGIRYLTPYFAGTSQTCSRLACLKLESCELSAEGVNHLLDSLPTLNGPLKSLSVAENYLGSKVAGALGRFLSTPIEVVDVAGIDFRPSGFQELQNMLLIKEDIKLVKINISKNRGGIETAKFLSKLLSQAPQLVDVNAASNCMPIESLPIISSALKIAKGNVQRLDLTGHQWDYKPEHASLRTEFVHNGKPILILPPSSFTAAPYDHDP
ncbi:RNI superfamily protein [Trifolium repens]|nr:RNI superfamily protein [Trifolium repens]